MSVCVKESGQLIKTAGLYRSEVPIGIADIYTEGERQIGLWIDGKPLYQKSIKLDDVTVPQSSRVLIGLSTYISNIDNVIGGEVIVIDGNTNIVLPSFQIATMSQYGLTYTINKADGIVISRGSDSGAVTRDFIATVRYTKTTDTATGALPNSSSSIYMMGDVSISSPQDGQALVFDATDNKWKNGEGGGGGTANIWAGTQEELEEEFDDIPDDTQIVVYDDYQEVVEGGTIYSEEEQVIGLWTDNRPLYQRTVKMTGLARVTASTIAISASDLANLGIDADEIKEMEFALDYYYNGALTKFTHNIYLNNSSIITVWMAGGNVYYWAQWGSASTGISIDLTLTFKYTKSTDSPLNAVVGKRTMYIASSDCYSTEEKEVGCATNGKPLYQKTILHTGTFTGSNDLQTIAHNILNLDECVSVNGFIYDEHETNPSWMPLPRFYTSNAFGISHITTSDIYIYIPSAFGTRLRNARITLQYTKTTDTAGSGTYTPASGKAVHYSTDEKVIGTWIDGSTIYEKTIHKVNTSVLNGTVIAHGISNFGMCISLEAVCYDESGTSFPIMSMGSNYADSSTEKSMGFRCNATNLIAYGKNEFSAYTTRHWYFTIRYTKATS